MESHLTESEMDAALQLIQLSGDTAELSREESVGDSHEISSCAMKVFGGELPRKKKRFRSIDEVYSVTAPVVNKRGKI